MDKITFITPETIKLFPKIPARNENSNRGRKRRRCMIATDTPEQEPLEEKKMQKEKKNRKEERTGEKKMF